MRVSDVLDFDAYYHDPRFLDKRPAPTPWWRACGDNRYYLHGGGWVRDAGAVVFHTSPDAMEQDTEHPRAFIAEHFYYFGNNAPVIPTAFDSLVHTGIGMSWHSDLDGESVTAFVRWLEDAFPEGICGLPMDRDLPPSCGC